MVRRFLIVPLLLIACSWKPGSDMLIEKAKWLVGTWQNVSEKGIVYEHWDWADKMTLAGKSYGLKDKDTLVFETIRLAQEDNKLFYIPVVQNQNKGLPTRFPLKTVSDSLLIFENKEHDFPQVISYTRITADSLVAEIAGVKNGKTRKQSFPMKRVSRTN